MRNGPAPALVIFDRGGVLVDGQRLSHQVQQQMLAEHGVAIGVYRAVQRFIGTSLRLCLARVAELLATRMLGDAQAVASTTAVEARLLGIAA